MGSMIVPACRCCMFVSCVYPVAVLNAAFCMTYNFLMLVKDVINIRHDYRLQHNRQTFTNYKRADWTQFTEDTESVFAQTTIPTNIVCSHVVC